MTDDAITQALKEVETFNQQGDRLEQVRNAMQKYRELLDEKINLEQRLADTTQKIRQLCDVELVQLFSTAQVRNFTLEAHGNYPALEAKRVPFYSAKLPEEPNQRQRAFDWLVDNGHSDIIKNLITVQLGRGEDHLAQDIKNLCQSLGVSYANQVSVHASTLKAFVKHEIEAGHQIPLDILGAYAGETVQLKAFI